MYYTYRVIRIQLHLTDEQDRRLRALGKRTKKSRAELIRGGIELLLDSEAPEADALLDLVGAAGPGPGPDVSEHHDALLYAAEPAGPGWQRKSS